MKKILIADDAEINRMILTEIFKEQFDIIEAEDGAQAIKAIDENESELSLILLDLMMPIKSGMDVLKHMNFHGQIDTIPVIMITGESTTDSDVLAYELGAADIIYKPFSRRVIIRRALNIIELYESRINIEKQLEARSTELTIAHKKLSKAHRMLESNNEFLINALSSVVEFRSLESGVHIQRVKTFTRLMLDTWMTLHPETPFTDEDIKLIVNASALHDIGKIAIPDDILLKPGKLTADERAIMEQHTTKGCEILDNFKQDDSDFYKYCYEICRYHHERYDGNGYPDKLSGDDIPLWAQIVSIVDVYDALVSPRVYKTPYEIHEACRMIYDGECGTFSPDILECFKTTEFQIFAATESISAAI